MEIYYLSAKNEKLDLVSWPYRVQTGDILDYAWEYQSSAKRYGGKITSFNRVIQEKTLTLTISAQSKTLYYEALNLFFETAEADILNESPGKLFVNNYYTSCYIFSSVKTEWEYGIESLDNEIKLVTEYPFWCQDVTTIFYKKEELETDTEYLDYPKTYPYDYKRSDSTIGVLMNNHYAESGYQMYIQGPCIDPSITISGHLYEVKTNIADSEYMLIDSRTKTVKKYDKYGNEYDAFNSRNKDSELFQRVPAGSNLVQWSGDFGFEITLFYERSEPKWTL